MVVMRMIAKMWVIVVMIFAQEVGAQKVDA
jgi:hypothetical protein